jgi:hypothetical protein
MLKNINQIAFYFVEEGPGPCSDDIKKNCIVNYFDFFFFSVFSMDILGGKITISFGTKIKKETHAHQKELKAHEVEKGRFRCVSDAPQFGSALSDSTRVVKLNRPKTNRRKTRPYCMLQYTVRKT